MTVRIFRIPVTRLILMARVDTLMTFDIFVTPQSDLRVESSMTGITNRGGLQPCSLFLVLTHSQAAFAQSRGFLSVK